MATVNSGIDICARALLLLGQRPIQSFTGSGTPATCKLLYQSTMEALISSYPWRFTIGKAKLSRLNETPIGHWKYAFQLPSAREGDPIRVYNTDSIQAEPISAFEVQGPKLLSDQTEIWVDFKNFPAESIWPPYFVTLAQYVMAAHLAIAETDDQAKYDRWWQVAYGTPSEGGMGGYFATARMLDAQANPASVLPSNNFSLLTVRGG